MVDQKQLHNKIYAGEPVIGHKKMPFVSKKFIQQLITIIDVKQDDLVLDLGSGDQGVSVKYPKNTVAIDIAKQAKFFTKAPFVAANALHLPFKSGSFDKVYCAEVIEHMPEQSYVKHIIAEIWRVLRKGGFAVISTPNENSLVAMTRAVLKGYKEPPGSIHTSFVSVHALKTLCKKQGFEINKLYTYLLPLPIPKYDYNLPAAALKVLYHVGKLTPKISHGMIIKVQK